MENDKTGENDLEFKPFYETFRATSFTMTLGMIYPNPSTDRWRLLAITIGFVSVTPMAILLFCDMIKLWREGLFLELLQHIAMVLPFYLGFLKNSLMFYKRRPGKEVLDRMNADYQYFNTLPETYKSIARYYIKNSHLYINIWNGTVYIIFLAFVSSSALGNIISQLFMAEPRRYMIYDVNRPGRDPQERYDTPYFEIIYVYTIYVSVIYVINFTGYDGLMLSSINHACLRLVLFTKKVEDAMLLKGAQLKNNMSEAIRDQIEISILIDFIQATYKVYFEYMYVVVIVEAVICLYLTNEGYSFDFQFTCVSLGTILHMYIPCTIADKLKNTGEQTAIRLYSAGWERMYDMRLRRCVPFMIARAQCPVVLKAFGLLTYEMDLFVRTMKSAYSMYTLLKSKRLQNEQ